MSEASEEFLAHFGVPGMKWGKHKSGSSGGGSDSSSGGAKAGPSRKELKALDKASVKADVAKRDLMIEAARQEYKTNGRQKYVDAKAQYKIDKVTIGKREATKAFNAVKEKNLADANVAQQAKSGKEATTALLITAGAIVLTHVAKGAIRRL